MVKCEYPRCKGKGIFKIENSNVKINYLCQFHYLKYIIKHEPNWQEIESEILWKERNEDDKIFRSDK